MQPAEPSLCGQYIGKEDHTKHVGTADQLLLVTTALSVVIMAAVYLLKPFILHVVWWKQYGRGEKKLQYISDDQRLPFRFWRFTTVVRPFSAQGDSAPMKISIVMNLINISEMRFWSMHSLKFGVDDVAIPTLLSRMYALWQHLFSYIISGIQCGALIGEIKTGSIC